MRNGCRLAAAALVCALGLVLAPGASALVAHGHNGHFFGLALHRGVRASSVAGSIAAQQQTNRPTHDSGQLVYHGGPVVHSSAPYLIFWVPSGESIPASSESLMKRYFTDVAADSAENDDVFGVTRQYTDATGFAGGHQTFNAANQALIDTHAYPSTDTTNCQGATPCITDTQLQQELSRLIAADGLPTDGASGSAELPANAPIYFIVLPGNVNVCDGTVGCASTTFCAYHSSATDGSDTLLYAAVPLLLAESQPKSCQFDGTSAVQEPNGDVADIVVGDLSHEDNESISDPLGTSWYDTTSGNEEADGCSMTGPFSPANETDPNAFLPTLGGTASAGTLYDQLISGDQYYTQSEWSNGDGTTAGSGCQMQPAAGTITPSFTESGATEPGSSLSFDPSASTSTNAISSETWNFGDGSTPVFKPGGVTSVSHAYGAPGTYKVMLTLVDNRGNVQSVTQSVTINPGPLASFSFSPSSPPQGTSVSFDGSASTPDSGAQITSYAWNFGDGTTASGPGAQTTHTYTTYGSYTVTLTVTDSDSLSASTTHQITVTDESPTAAFTIAPDPAFAGNPVAFNGAGSSDPDGTITSYAWNFGDGTTATGPGAQTTHSYGAAGTYTVTLTVTDSSGQTGRATAQLEVIAPSPTGSITPLVIPAAPPPHAGLSITTTHPAVGVPVQFSGASSSDPGGSITSYSWSFGDGGHATGVAPTHTYRTAGIYQLSLTVHTSTGTSATTGRSIVVVAGSRITKVSVSGKGATRVLAITLNGPGTLLVGPRRFRVLRARTIRVRVTPTAAERPRLTATHRLRIVVRLQFTPQVGARSTRRIPITFRS